MGASRYCSGIARVTMSGSGSRMSPIDLRHLRFAVAAADQGSFRRAAEELCVRQSTISRCIREFEHFLGAQLFERSSGGIALTPIGRIILQVVRAILEELDELAAIARSNRSSQGGRLVIGFCSSLSTGNLRAALLELKEKFPLIEFATVEKSRMRLARLLRSGLVDIVIAAEDACLTEFESLPLWSERILVAIPKDHELSYRDVLYWTDLRSQTVLLSRHDPGRELEGLLRSKLVAPADRPKIENHDISRGSIKALVSMQVGIGLILESDLGANLPSPVYRELRDGTGLSRLGFSAFWRAENKNPGLASFLGLLRERYPSLSAET